MDHEKTSGEIGRHLVGENCHGVGVDRPSTAYRFEFEVRRGGPRCPDRGSQVCNGLAGGGSMIRTLGPPPGGS